LNFAVQFYFLIFISKIIDKPFIDQLPANVDPCGENGEYHTFCFDGPIFKKKINFTIGEKIYKPLEIKNDDNHTYATNTATKGFWFCELAPIA